MRDKLSIPEHYQSLAAVKFEKESINKLNSKKIKKIFVNL